MVDLFAELAVGESINLLPKAGENAIKRAKASHDWKRAFVNSGKFFIEHEKYAEPIFNDLAEILSKENMTELSKKLKNESGYDLKDNLHKEIMKLLGKYEIPHDLAKAYSLGLMYIIINEIKAINPEKYNQLYQKEWKEEEERDHQQILNKVEKVYSELKLYRSSEVKIHSADEMDLILRQSTDQPKIGVDFFVIDDDDFQEAFGNSKDDDCIYIKCKSREEAIYCIINELWRINDARPIFVVQSEEDWEKLRKLNSKENIYIPWFYANEITSIEGNTTIFVYTEDIPIGNRKELKMHRRTRSTIIDCLVRAGMDHDDANRLFNETHGLFVPMKKKIIKGVYLKKPDWLSSLDDNILKTCLLVEQWTDAEGDQAVIETLSGMKYRNFMDCVKPFIAGEDPLIHIIGRNNDRIYTLASVENTWDYITVNLEDPIWGKFKHVLVEIINEAEQLFIYSNQERLLAQIKGEKLFWSSGIRMGMIRSLIMKAYYKNDEDCQYEIDHLINEILGYVQTTDQWKYISRFFMALCEASPRSIIRKLTDEKTNPTGLLGLFERQSEDFILERNAYIDILFGTEMLLTQTDYAIEASKFLLFLDDKSYEYHANNVEEIINKVLCPWCNFSAINSSDQKIRIAKLAFEEDQNAWDLVYNALTALHKTYIGNLQTPQYRDYASVTSVPFEEMYETLLAYAELLILHMNFSPEKWGKLLQASEDMDEKIRNKVFDALRGEISQMEDLEVMMIKDSIREIIYKHRFFSSASWAMPEDVVMQYETLLNDIHTEKPEYEYEYLYKDSRDYVLLYPTPYNQEESSNRREENDALIRKIRREKLIEFQNYNYDLELLAHICGREERSLLGWYAADYWDSGHFSEIVFRILINAQKSGQMAREYYNKFAAKGAVEFEYILEVAKELNCDNRFLTELYIIESTFTKELPKISEADEEIKKLFWRSTWLRFNGNEEWVLSECCKYGTNRSYYYLLFDITSNRNDDIEFIYEYLKKSIDIERDTTDSTMTGYYLEELLKKIYPSYLDNKEKRETLALIELRNSYILDWEDMKYMQMEMKQYPKLFADMVSIIYKKDEVDYEKIEYSEEELRYISNVRSFYERAEFCPAEENGYVSEDKLREWIEELQKLLDDNKQSSLLNYLLGRLLAFSPAGEDGHSPCEAVRNIIEDYADESLINQYHTSIYNKRGVFTPSAGKSEKQIANRYKENADYLRQRWPQTATIYDRLSRTYAWEAENERKDAENV